MEIIKKNQSFLWFVCVTAAALFVTNIATATDKYEIKVGTKYSSFKVDSKLEAKGLLIMDPTEETRTVKMNVLANYRYDERLAEKNGAIKSIRYYDLAKSRVGLGKGSVTYDLDDANKYLIIERRSKPVGNKRIRYQTPQPTLTAKELDLLISPANSMVLTRWLEVDGVEIEEEWETAGEFLADILTWDSVETNNVKAKITKIARSKVSILVTGDALGNIDGADAEVTVKGTCIYDTAAGYVTSARLKINENRDASLVAPGYEATIWVENNITADTQGVRLTNAALGKLKMNPQSRADKFLLEMKCGDYTMLHPRHWRVINNSDQRTVLRCIKDGDVLGQCDVIPLPDQPAGVVPTLDDFRRNVENALAETQARIVNSQQSPAISENQWMRIDAVGTSNEVEMRWIYYTIITPDNRRVQLLFSVEEDAFNNFNGFDQEIVNAIQFVAPSDASAKERSASRSKTNR